MTSSQLHAHNRQSGSTVAMFGMEPHGYDLAAKAVRQGVSLISNVSELREMAVQTTNGTGRHLHTIIIVVCPGDDLSRVQAIYNLAIEIHILVTVIIISPTNSGNEHNSGTSGLLQGLSDIIVISTDKNCLDHILEMAVG